MLLSVVKVCLSVSLSKVCILRPTTPLLPARRTGCLSSFALSRVLFAASDVQSFLSSKSVGGQSSLSALSQPYKILVLSPPGSSSSSSSPSLMLRHAAYKLLPLFSFGYVVNTRGLYADKTAKEDLFNALRNPPTWLSPPRSGNTEGGGKEKQGPNFVLPFNLKEEDLLTSAIFALFVDEGTAGGVRTYVEKLPLSKSKEGQKVLFHQLNHLLASFQQVRGQGQEKSEKRKKKALGGMVDRRRRSRHA